MASLTEKALRDRFKAAVKERDEIIAAIKPMRDARDKVVAAMQPLEVQARDLHLKIRAAEVNAGLFELHEEIAMISRALKFKTGEPG